MGEFVEAELSAEGGAAGRDHQDDRAVLVVCSDPLVLRGAGHALTQLPWGVQIGGCPANLITDHENPCGRASSGLHHDDDRFAVCGDSHFPPKLTEVHPAAVESSPPRQ